MCNLAYQHLKACQDLKHCGNNLRFVVFSWCTSCGGFAKNQWLICFYQYALIVIRRKASSRSNLMNNNFYVFWNVTFLELFVFLYTWRTGKFCSTYKELYVSVLVETANSGQAKDLSMYFLKMKTTVLMSHDKAETFLLITRYSSPSYYVVI